MRKIKDIYHKNNPFLIINFKDLLDYQENQIIDKESVSRLIYLLTNKPYHSFFTENVKEIDVQRHLGQLCSPDLYRHIQIGFTQFQEKPTQLNELRAHYLSRFGTFEGVISQFDEKPLVRVIQSVWECDDCRKIYVNKGAKQPTKSQQRMHIALSHYRFS